MTEPIFIDDATDCGSCRVLLIPGDMAYRDINTGVIGCCISCCCDAALIHHDRQESDDFHSAFAGDCN